MTQTIVALYDEIGSAEQAVRGLRAAGVDDRNISLMTPEMAGRSTRGSQPTETDDTSSAQKGAGIGAALGGLGGLLVGLGALTIPGIGPVVAAGPLATAVAGLAGAGAGALAGGATGGLLGALADAGLPEDHASFYAEGVRRGGTLVAVRVPEGRLDEVRDVLEQHDPVDLDERAATWRQEGWTRYDPNAGPYTGAPMRASHTHESMLASSRLGTETARPAETPSHLAGAGAGSAAVYAHGRKVEPDSNADLRREPTAASSLGQAPQARVVAADYDRFAPAFRGHYQTNLAQSGFQYEHFEPAYQYGLTLGNYEPYRGLDWMQIEREARLAWENRNPNTWDRVREAVRYGWERVKMPVR